MLQRAVISHPDLEQATKIAVVSAINKFMWIQNDLFSRHYIHDRTPANTTWFTSQTTSIIAVAVAVASLALAATTYL